MAQAKIVVNVTDKHGNPMIGLEVELVDTGAFTPANHDPIEHVVAIETTDISGTATFTGLTPSMYYARPRITRPDLRIQVMMASGIGILCYSAVVDPNGRGTHTTIQSAIDALGLTGGTVLICAGTYQENLTVAGDTENLWLIGISRNCVTIQGTAASPTLTVDAAGTGPVINFRLEHLTLDHTGSETLLYFNSAGGGQPTKVDLNDLRFLSGAVGIDLSNASGGPKFSLRDLLFESTCVAAGQLQVSDLHVSSCKLYCSGNGLYVAGSSAATGIRIEGCLFGGGGSYCLRIGNATDVQISNCRFLSLGVATAGILASHGLGELVVDGCIIDCVDGIGIDLSNAVGIAIVISNCSLTCASSQATAREGISVAGYCVHVSISDCHISGFESFGIRLKTLIATGAQHFVLDGNIIRNGEDTHSISIGGWDYGTVTGCVLIGAGGANTTYGVYGAAGTTYVVIVGNVEQDHDGMTNLTNGVDGNVIGSNTGGSGSGMGPSPHDPVTLDANADTLLSLSTQELGLDTQLANLVFAGPDAGDAAVPAFRSLVEADIPGAFLTDDEHTAIGDAAPHHARYIDTEAIAAIEGEATLDLAGDVTIAADKSLSVNTIVETTADAGVTLEGVKALDSFLEFAEIAKPANPAENKLRLYTKDKAGVSALYFLQDDGTEVEVGAGGGGGATVALDNLAGVAINTSLLPANDSAIDLGSATPKYWRAAYIDTIYLNATAALGGGTAGKVSLTGTLQTSGSIGVKGTTPADRTWIKITPTGVSEADSIIGLEINPSNATITADNKIFYGVYGAPSLIINDRTGMQVYGLSFRSGIGCSSGKSGTASLVKALSVGVAALAAGAGQTVTATGAWGIQVAAPHLMGYAGATPSMPTYYGVEVEGKDTTYIAGAYGFKCGDFTSVTGFSRLLELGPAEPYFRVEGGGAPAGVNSNAIVNFGGALYRLTRNAGTGAVETVAI